MRDGKSADQRPLVVVSKEKNAVVIVAVDDAAARANLEPGLPLANARMICPELNVVDEDKAADAQALNAVADWCDRFTPLVALDPPHGLFLDITGCARLFGDEKSLLTNLCHALGRQGFVVNAAVASTPVCARTMTRAVSGAIVLQGEEKAAVSPLPLFALGASEETIRGLRRAGLKTIGDVAIREPHEITARFGAGLTALLQQALGQSDAPISPRKPLPDYVVEKRFPEPVATDAVIASTIDLLAHMLIASMEKSGKGARRLEASFFRTDGAVSSIMVEAGQPVTQTHTVARLFREKLDALADPLDPGFGFDMIRLSASHVELVIQEQRDLDTHAQDDDEIAALIDRITARIGKHRVLVYLPQDTHIPERAAIAVPAQHRLAAAHESAWMECTRGEPPLRPLRMFGMPEPIKIIAPFPHGPPAGFQWKGRFHRLVHIEGPERIVMEWWNEEEILPQSSSRDDAFNRLHPPHGEPQDAIDHKKLTRDYFRAEDRTGLRFWLYREGVYGREVRQFCWFLHGLFA